MAKNKAMKTITQGVPNLDRFIKPGKEHLYATYAQVAHYFSLPYYTMVKLAKQTSIVVSAFGHSVSGTVRHGDIVDIYARDPVTDELVLMISGVYVDDAFNSSGDRVEEDGTAVVFTIYVAPGEEEQINKAIAYDGIQLYLTDL